MKNNFRFKILIISDLDSRIKWAESLYKQFNCNTTVKKYYKKNFKITTETNQFDVIILALGGGANYKFLLKFTKYFKVNNSNKRPIIISGFNGITDPENIHALLCRLGSDFICLNSRRDFDVFSNHLKDLNFSKHTLYLSGLLKSYNISRIKNKIVFFAQPDIPKTKSERTYIVKKLIEIASKFPDRKVYIKPRAKKSDKNITHQEIFFYQDILKKFNVNNIEFIYEDVEEILLSTFMSITVSSTVALESIYNNIDTVILSDFGVRQEYGNNHFIGSGCLLSFNDLLLGNKPSINQVWKKRFVLVENTRFEGLVNCVIERIELQRDNNIMIPMEPLYYSIQNAPYFYENSLRINARNDGFFTKIKDGVKKMLCHSKTGKKGVKNGGYEV